MPRVRAGPLAGARYRGNISRNSYLTIARSVFDALSVVLCARHALKHINFYQIYFSDFQDTFSNATLDVTGRGLA